MLRVWALIWLWVAGCARAFGSEWSYEGATITLANLNISYSDPATGMNRTDVGEVGKFGSGAVGVAAGILIVGHSLDGGDPRHNRHGCKMPWAVVPPNEPWVALVSRGECADREKIANAQALNASAILVYAKDAQEHLQKIALSSFSRKYPGGHAGRLCQDATCRGHEASGRGGGRGEGRGIPNDRVTVPGLEGG